MENEYMNVCVNAKPNTIILQSKPDEVTGGYTDKDGVWHDLGASVDLGPYAGKKFKVKARTITIGTSGQRAIPVWAKKIGGTDSHLPKYVGFITYNYLNMGSAVYGVSDTNTSITSTGLTSNADGSIAQYAGGFEIEMIVDLMDDTDRTYFDDVFEEIV